VYVGQIAKHLADQQESQFPANTQVNPKEHCKSIIARQGIVIGKGIGDNLSEENENERREKISLNENEEKIELSEKERELSEKRVLNDKT